MIDAEEVRNSFDFRKALKISGGIFAAVIILAGIGLYYIDSQKVERQSQQWNVSFTVADANETANQTDIGIETGQHLHFGKMPNGTNQRRFIGINSSHYTLALMSSEGNVSEYLEFDEKFAFQGEKEIAVEMQSEKTGYYEGVLKAEMQAPRTRWALRWLEFKRKYLY